MTLHGKWLRVGLLGLTAVCVPAAPPALAQPVPTGPVKIITPIGAGSGPDAALRIVADQLGQMWGQQAVVINQPGGGGVLAARTAATAAPDGNTLFMALASTYVAMPELQSNLPFKVNDFAPIGFVGEVPMAIATSPTLAVSSLADVIALSKKQAGGLTVAVSTRGELPHLTVELLRSRSGAELTPVHYPSMAQGVNDVISGRVAVALDGVAGPIARGQLNLLAVGSGARVLSRPTTPTMAETVPGFVATGWWVLVAPPGTPGTITKKLSDDLRAVLARPNVNQLFERLGAQTRAMSPQELSNFINEEQRLWKPVIKQAGLAAQ